MSIFKLQQFSITQKANAMKVCTDSIVFGALMPITHAKHVLDVGTGTGILSLMAAQRGAQAVTALELMPTSAAEASNNVQASPWHNNIEVIEQDFNEYETTTRFDVIISNPPFFEQHVKSNDKLRSNARHTDTLNYRQLLTKSHQLLTKDGIICLLLPCHALNAIIEISAGLGLSLIKQTDFITMQGGVAKVCALILSNDSSIAFNHESLTIFDSHQQYSQDSTRLLRQFLLRFTP